MLSDEMKLIKKIKTLDETIWESQVSEARVRRWLENFKNNDDDLSEQYNALYLLSKFTYFGSREMREMLISLFRDFYKYPILESIRETNNHTTDVELIENLFNEELKQTRFLGIGNPSESGSHLLYYFRQENKLPTDLFINTHEIYSGSRSSGNFALRNPDIKRYVFIDDFCGSGSQASTYSDEILTDLKELDTDLEIIYLVLLATKTSIHHIKSTTLFDDMRAVFELDESYQCFTASSRYYPSAINGIDQTFTENMCRTYGNLLMENDKYMKDYPLGFQNGQLLIAFHHNTPNNTLPIIWSQGNERLSWQPIFRRYPKVYGGTSKK